MDYDEVKDRLTMALAAVQDLSKSAASSKVLGTEGNALATAWTQFQYLCVSVKGKTVRQFLKRATTVEDASLKEKYIDAAREWMLPYAEIYAMCNYHQERLAVLRAFPPLPASADSWTRLGYWHVQTVLNQFEEFLKTVKDPSEKLDQKLHEFAKQLRDSEELPTVAVLNEVIDAIWRELLIVKDKHNVGDVFLKPSQFADLLISPKDAVHIKRKLQEHLEDADKRLADGHWEFRKSAVIAIWIDKLRWKPKAEK